MESPQTSQTSQAPQAPAWLRTYKTRAAPFTSGAARTPDASTLPPMGKISEEPDVSRFFSRSEPNVHDRPNRYSFTFPSTLSLGLQSFGEPEDTTHEPEDTTHEPEDTTREPEDTTPSQSTIHPAHRIVYSNTDDRNAASNSSSVTIKDDMGQCQNTTKNFDGEHEPRWKEVVKGWIRKLACSGER